MIKNFFFLIFFLNNFFFIIFFIQIQKRRELSICYLICIHTYVFDICMHVCMYKHRKCYCHSFSTMFAFYWYPQLHTKYILYVRMCDVHVQKNHSPVSINFMCLLLHFSHATAMSYVTKCHPHAAYTSEPSVLVHVHI